MKLTKTLWTKLITIGLGATMALGVGLTASKIAEEVNAAGDYSATISKYNSTAFTTAIADGALTFGTANNHIKNTNTGGASFTVTYAKNSSSTTSIFNNTAGEIRLYGGSGNGAQLTFALTGAFVMKSVTVNTSTNLGYSINGGTTITTSGVETALSDLTSFVLKNVASSTNQVRITSVVVGYSAAGGQTRTLQSIAITSEPTDKSYYVGETFNTTGLLVTGTYDTAPLTENVTSLCTVSPAHGYTFVSGDISANKTVTVSLSPASSKTFTVSVSAAPTLSSIAISGSMTKTSYYTEDSWDPTGLVVTGTYSDSSTADVTSSVSWSYNPATPSSVSTTNVTITASVGAITSPQVTRSVSVSVAPFESSTLAYPAGSGTTNMTASNNATTVGLNINLFEVLSTERTASPLHIGLNNVGEIRLYGAADPAKGNILTVNLLDEDYYIFSFVVNYGTSVAPVIIKSGGDSVFSGTPTASGAQEFSLLNDSSFSIENNADGTTQVYIKSIEIYYVTAAQAAALFADEVMTGIGENANGNCATVLDNLNNMYDSMRADAKIIFDTSSDSLFVNARVRMSYLANWVAAQSPAGVDGDGNQNSRSSLIASAVIGIIGLTTIAGFYFIGKKKRMI